MDRRSGRAANLGLCTCFRTPFRFKAEGRSPSLRASPSVRDVSCFEPVQLCNGLQGGVSP